MNLFWKILGVTGIVVLAAVAVTCWVLPPYIDRIIHRELVNACSLATGTECTVESTRLRLLPQYLRVRDLKIANPKGFKEPYILQIGSTRAGVRLLSLSGEPVELRTITIKDLHLEYEQTKCSSNLEQLMDNARLVVEKAEEGAYAQKQIKIDEIIFEGTTVHLVVDAIWPISKKIDLHLDLPRIQIVNPRDEFGQYLTLEELVSFVAAEVAWEIVHHPKVPSIAIHVIKSSLSNLMRFFII